MIFYFTGTGNSLWVAKMLSEYFHEALISIATELNEKKSNEDFIRYSFVEGEKEGIKVCIGYDLEGNEVVLNKSGTNGWLDRESTSTTVILDPVEFGFKAGDTVKLGIYAYTRYGETNTGAQLFDSAATEKVSSVYAINNAGIIHVKPAGSWVEGQVYVKVNNEWREAESVYTKVSGAWKESV
jgi:hypothetical protein